MGLADWLPFASSHCKCCGHCGFGQPRSNLFCHHNVISLRCQDGRSRAPWIRSVRKYASPRLLMPSSVDFPPLEHCRGTSPSQADTLSTVIKAVCIGDRGDQRTCRQGTDARNLLKFAAELTTSVPRDDLALKLFDLLIEFLSDEQSNVRSTAATPPVTHCSRLRAGPARARRYG